MTSASNGASTLAFWYDGLNRQIKRTINGVDTYSVWDGWNLLEEHGAGNSTMRCYGEGAATDEMVVAFDGGVYPTVWYAQDGRGNTTHLFGDGNQLLEAYTYNLSGLPKIVDPSGNLLSQSAFANRFLFTGRDYFKEANIYDYRNRFYFVGLNRFLQTDPIGFKGDPGNLYRYCGNDPVDRGDPTGLVAEKAFGPLTSFDGGDWVRGSDGLTASDWDHKRDQAGMDGGRGGNAVDNGGDAGPGSGGRSMGREHEGKKNSQSDYGSFFDAADAQQNKAYNMSSRTREAGTEIWQRDDGSANYRSDPPRIGNKLKDVHDKWENGKFLSFTVDPQRHPAGYHCAGWMYAHGFYRPEVPSADQHRAFEKGWSAFLVTPAQGGALFKNQHNKVLYNYPDTPSNQ